MNSNIDLLLADVLAGKPISISTIEFVCKKAAEILLGEPNIVELSGPVTVVGDIHGQYHDLLEVFEICGKPPTTSYLFLGDYVDRGYYSIECIVLLLLYKIQYPSRVILLRGNHESKQITQVYGFYDEAIRKYNTFYVWKLLIDTFNYLPLAAIIGNAVMGIHGGLSPNAEDLDSIRAIERIKEIPHDGLLCDIVWSDPDGRPGWNASPRGAGFTFGEDVSAAFLKRNNLSLLVRAHQLTLDGYTWNHGKRVLTVFSAPNYCYRCNNKGGLFRVDESLHYDLIRFDNAPSRGFEWFEVGDYE